jgi:hypothetical protein
MLAGRQHRLGKEGGGQFNDAVIPRQLAAEVTEDGSSLGGGEIAGVLPPGDRGRDLNGGNAGDIERVTRLGADEGFDSGAADLDDMAFDKSTGIEEIIRHLNDARG